MIFHVELAARAVRDLVMLYEEKNVAGSRAAWRWFNGLERAVRSLETNPLRCPAAPESLNSKRRLLHLLYGKKPHIYRVIFELDQRNSRLLVLTIRHGARNELALGISEG